MEFAYEREDQVCLGGHSGNGMHVCLPFDAVGTKLSTDISGFSASAAVIVRIPYLHDYKDPDFLCEFLSLHLHTPGKINRVKSSN